MIWKQQTVEAVSKILPGCKASAQVTKYTCWQLNYNNCKKQLSKATDKNAVTIALPYPDGSIKHFAVKPAGTMSEELAKQFPDLKSYAGNGTEDKTMQVRIDLNETGFHALATSPAGQWLVEPFCTASKNEYTVYWKNDFKSNRPPFNESK